MTVMGTPSISTLVLTLSDSSSEKPNPRMVRLGVFCVKLVK